MKALILLVDDSPSVAELAGSFLAEADYRVHHAVDADDALEFLKEKPVDLLLLDIALPGVSGLKLLEILKQDPKTAALPVIMLTAQSGEAVKLQGLRGGADDYLVKPFSPKELVARVEALLRRVNRSGQVANVLKGRGIAVDLDRREVAIKGKRATLTQAEYDLLTLFLTRQGQVLTYQTIAEVLGHEDWTSNNVSAHVKNLRTKLGAAGASIETVYGAGYRFLEAA